MENWMTSNGYSTSTTSNRTSRHDYRTSQTSGSERLRSSSALDYNSKRPTSDTLRSSSALDYTESDRQYRRPVSALASYPSSGSSRDYTSTNKFKLHSVDYSKAVHDYKQHISASESRIKEKNNLLHYTERNLRQCTNYECKPREATICSYTRSRPKSLDDYEKTRYINSVKEYNSTIGLLYRNDNTCSSKSNLTKNNGDLTRIRNGVGKSSSGDLESERSIMPRLPTMQGSDRAWYRQVKEVLESPPNKGPPYTPSRLSPHIYLGNIRNAEDYSLLQRLGITHVLNLAGTRRFDRKCCPYPPETGVRQFLMIMAEDHTEYNMAQHFPECISFLDECKHSGGIALIHCNLGINRSGAISAVYLMADTKKNLMEVINYLKLKRSVVLCNRAFRRQVIQYARDNGHLDLPEKTTEVRRRNSDTNDFATEVKKKGTVHMFSRTGSSQSCNEEGYRKCHKRSKSDPVENIFVHSGLDYKQNKGVEHPNGMVTPSMQRPLRLSQSTTSVRSPMTDEDEDEAEYRFDTTHLDTLYEEIEQMNLTAPHANSARFVNRQRRTRSAEIPRASAEHTDKAERPRGIVQTSAGDVECSRDNVRGHRGSKEHSRGQVEHPGRNKEHSRGTMEQHHGKVESSCGNGEDSRGNEEHSRVNVRCSSGKAERSRSSAERPRSNVEHTHSNVEHHRGNAECLPGATTSTIAIHVPENPRVPAGSRTMNGPRAYQNSAYLTVPAKRQARSGGIIRAGGNSQSWTDTPQSQPRPIQAAGDTPMPMNQQSRATVTFAVNDTTKDTQVQANKSFFGTLFRRKPTSTSLPSSSSSKPWRRSVNF